MKASECCLALIKEFEGLRLRAYRDGAGILSIGFGSTDHVYDGMVITPAEAFRRLQDHLVPLEVQLERLVKVPLTQAQTDGLIAFCYNCGIGTFEHSSILALINQGDKRQAADHLLLYNKIHDPKTGALVVCDGLTRRREAERALFLGA